MRASFFAVAVAAAAVQAAPVIETRQDVPPIPAACTPTPGLDTAATYDKVLAFQKVYLFDKDITETFKYFSADFQVCSFFFLCFFFCLLQRKLSNKNPFPTTNRASSDSSPSTGISTGPSPPSRGGARPRATPPTRPSPTAARTSPTTWARRGQATPVTTLSGRMAALFRSSRRGLE